MSSKPSAGDLNARTDGDAPPTQKPDATAIGRVKARAVEHLFDIRQLHFRDFDRDDREQRVMTDGGRDVPEFEYSERGISTGDVVVDLASGKSLQVVGTSTMTVGEHPKTRSDDTAEMFGADPEEPVYSCVFLPDGERVSPPSKTYAYPESRLIRYPVERATEYTGSMQNWLRTAFLNELADGVRRSGNEELRRDLRSLIADVYSEDIADIFEELVETSESTVQTGGPR